jgi:hypothetical protein
MNNRYAKREAGGQAVLEFVEPSLKPATVVPSTGCTCHRWQEEVTLDQGFVVYFGTLRVYKTPEVGVFLKGYTPIRRGEIFPVIKTVKKHWTWYRIARYGMHESNSNYRGWLSTQVVRHFDTLEKALSYAHSQACQAGRRR